MWWKYECLEICLQLNCNFNFKMEKQKHGHASCFVVYNLRKETNKKTQQTRIKQILCLQGCPLVSHVIYIYQVHCAISISWWTSSLVLLDGSFSMGQLNLCTLQMWPVFALNVLMTFAMIRCNEVERKNREIEITVLAYIIVYL